MARAFETKPGRAPLPALQRPAAAARTVPPAADFPQLARRLHLGAPIQRRAGGPGRDFSDIAGPGRPPLPGALPAGLRADVEARSGLPMDDVRVHRNSPKPRTIGALAYAQGRDIHLGPGQERHLAHEAWHVVQQKQGRVRPTRQMWGAPINDDPALEREADAMRATPARAPRSHDTQFPAPRPAGPGPAALQRVRIGPESGPLREITSVEELKAESDVLEETLNGLDERSLREVRHLVGLDHRYDTLEDFLTSERMAAMLDKHVMFGGYRLVRKPIFSRRDSKENLFSYDGTEAVKALRASNFQFRSQAAGKDDKTNYIRLSISANYRDETDPGAPVLTSVTRELLRQWVSGAQQPVLDQTGRDATAWQDRSMAIDTYVKNDAWLPEARGMFFSKLISENDNQDADTEYRTAVNDRQTQMNMDRDEDDKLRLDLLSQKDIKAHVGLSKREAGPARSGADILVGDEAHRHSEVAAAADANLTPDITALLSQIDQAIPHGSTVLSYVLHVDSYPNTMCMNICRSAVRDIYGRFATLASSHALPVGPTPDGGGGASDTGSQKGEAETAPALPLMPTIRRSGRFATALIVTADVEFNETHNKRLNRFGPDKDTSVPEGYAMADNDNEAMMEVVARHEDFPKPTRRPMFVRRSVARPKPTTEEAKARKEDNARKRKTLDTLKGDSKKEPSKKKKKKVVKKGESVVETGD